MERMKLVPLALLVILSLKTLIVGAQAPDIGMLAVMAALCAFYEFKLERVVFEEIKKQQATQDIAIENTFKEVQSLKSYVTSVKMNSTIPNVRASNGKTNITF